MAKALELTAESLTLASPVPKAAQINPTSEQKRYRVAAKPLQKVEREPLQIRWPGEEVKAAKLAALQLDFPTVSDFMLACFHAYMKLQKQN